MLATATWINPLLRSWHSTLNQAPYVSHSSCFSVHWETVSLQWLFPSQGSWFFSGPLTFPLLTSPTLIRSSPLNLSATGTQFGARKHYPPFKCQLRTVMPPPAVYSCINLRLCASPAMRPYSKVSKVFLCSDIEATTHGQGKVHLKMHLDNFTATPNLPRHRLSSQDWTAHQEATWNSCWLLAHKSQTQSQISHWVIQDSVRYCS